MLKDKTKQKGRDIVIPANDKQRLAWKAWLNDSIDDVVYGGYAGGGKTMLGGQVLTGTALQYPGTKLFLGRKELKTLMVTSYVSLTQKVFPQYGLVQEKDWKLNGQLHVINFRNGSKIDLLDLAEQPSDPLFDRFGSSEYTQGWIEEASEAPFKAWDVLKSRIGRWKNKELNIKSKLLVTLNPSQDWPYRIYYYPWKKAGKIVDLDRPLVSVKGFTPEGKEVNRTYVFIPAIYKDNPFTSGDYERNLATLSDPVLKARLMDGDWDYARANDTLFDAETIAALFHTVVAQTDDIYLIVDVARLGDDRIVLNHFRGWDSFRVDLYQKLKTTQTAELIRNSADMYEIPRENILIDEDGIGGGVLDQVPGALGFSGDSAPFGRIIDKNNLGEIKSVKENYRNLKAQCTYHLSQMARDRKVRCSEPNLEVRELLAQDLQQFKRKDPEKGEGKLQIVPKEEMRVALGRSPDVGDTFMMRSYFDVREREEVFQTGGQMSVFIPDYEIA